MAGERLGKAYEAVLKIVLDRLKCKNIIRGKIFWNEIPEGISVEPDFVIGDSLNTPNIIIMSTHCNSSKNATMKLWRNLGELCEVKSAISPSPYALNIVFDSVMGEGQKKLQNAIFDGQVIVGDTEYGKELQQMMVEIEPNLPTDQNEKVERLLAYISGNMSAMNVINQLETDVSKAICQDMTNVGSLWEMEQKRTHDCVCKSKNTSIRRGMSKLLIFEDIDLALRLYRGKRVEATRIPAYIYSIGLAKRNIGRAAASDEEIQNAVDILSDDEIRTLYHTMDNNEVVVNWLFQLRNVTCIEFFGNYVIGEFKSLCNANLLYERIIDLHDNIYALVESEETPEQWPPKDVWLVTYIIEIIKAYSGKANGYGIAQLATDVINAGFGEDDDKANVSQFDGGLGFSAWLIRKKSPFKEELVKGIANVLVSKLTEIGEKEVRQLIETRKVESTLINNILRLPIPKMGFAP